MSKISFSGLSAGAVMLAMVASPALAQTSPKELASANGCMACHDIAKKLIGPGFAQIAAKYKDGADAPALLAGKIRGGSAGTWGRISMPPQTQVSQADALALAKWILAQ
mgnify:CR=1 FL=1